MRKLFAANMIMFNLFLGHTVFAETTGDAGAGKLKAVACQVCHGKGGKSTNPLYPVLAGQHSRYIIKQLKAFKAGTRKDPIMNGMAAPLSEADMKDIAAYFSGNGN
jgi:cytochrome c553